MVNQTEEFKQEAVRIALTSGLPALGGEFGEYPVDRAQAALVDEPIVDRLLRVIPCRCIAPAQSVPDHEDDTAHNPPIIHSRNAVRQRKIGLKPVHLRLAKQQQLRYRQHLISAAIESSYLRQRNQFNGP